MELPEFLQHEFVPGPHRVVPIERLRVALRCPDRSSLRYVAVQATPHYGFARHILGESSTPNVPHYPDYDAYVAQHGGGAGTDDFRALVGSIRDNGYDGRRHPILVFRHWRRRIPRGRWDVADGFHRLAVLAALDYERVEVQTLGHARSPLARIRRRLGGGSQR